jgi:hypothetical protein
MMTGGDGAGREPRLDLRSMTVVAAPPIARRSGFLCDLRGGPRTCLEPAAPP